MFTILFVLLCGAYLAAAPITPSMAAALLKVLPILLLLQRALVRGAERRRTYLALGLAFSLLGDLALALSPSALFIHGVAAFLVAHVFYIVAFRPHVHYSTRSAILAAIVAAWCVAVAAIVYPHLGQLRLPVVAYMAVIATMGIAAAFATGPRLTLFAGAFAFIVSDSVIAMDRFVAPFHYAPYLVMTTYYLGQFKIVEGVLGWEGADAATGGLDVSNSLGSEP